MSLLYMSKAKMEESVNVADKPFSVLYGQLLFATHEGSYHTTWVDLATYSSIATRCNISRHKYDWRRRNKYDDWGRIQRTEIWQ